jgi:hypothetical protein
VITKQGKAVFFEAEAMQFQSFIVKVNDQFPDSADVRSTAE